MKIMRNVNEDNEGDEDEDESREEAMNNTGESSGEKMLTKMDDELEYEGEEQEKNEINDNESESDNEMEQDNDENNNNTDDEGDANKSKKEESKSLKSNKSRKKASYHVNRILSISDLIVDYNYDKEHLRWSEMTFQLDALKPRLDLYSIIQKEAKHCYIAKVDGIKRCFLNQSTLPEDRGCYKLVTEGINVDEVIKHASVLNASKLYLNDIHLMASKFGIEAANRVIINVYSFFYSCSFLLRLIIFC